MTDHFLARALPLDTYSPDSGAGLGAVGEQLKRAAEVDLPLLISGANTELASRMCRVLHASSSRRAGPFVEVRCRNVPRFALEQQLFGSHTGVAASENGTLLLHEVGGLPSEHQRRLLELLRSGVFSPAGGTLRRRASVRVVAAAREPLDPLVAAGCFCPELLGYLGLLNLRVAETQPQVDSSEAAPLSAVQSRAGETYQGATRVFQRDLVLGALKCSGWNVTEAARRLDVSRSYLYKLICQFELERD